MGSQSIYHHGDKVVRAVARKSKDQHFLNNEDFKSWIKDYQQKCIQAESEGKPIPQIPNNIGKAFLQIATALSKKYYFIGYTWIDEMISDGITRCCEAVRKFDPEKGTSAFAYFQQTIYFEFIGRIQSEKKQKIIRASIVQNIGSQLEDVAKQEVDADEDFHTAMGEILALQSMEIDYGTKREKKEPKIEMCPFDIFSVDENGLQTLNMDENEDSPTE